MRTGRAEKVMALQKLSKRRARVPSLEIRMLSPCTEWNCSGGRLLGPGHEEGERRTEMVYVKVELVRIFLYSIIFHLNFLQYEHDLSC